MKVIEKLNTPLAVIAALAFFIVFDGLLLYRYQQNSMPAGIAPTKVEETAATTKTTASENMAEQTEEMESFGHLATSENTVDNSTYVNHPLASGNPNAILLVARSSEPDGDGSDAHPIGVWYDANRGGEWAIFNQDLAPMSEDTTFEVNIWREPGDTVFVHRATFDNTAINETYVDHPSTDQNPNAVLSITPNWNPGEGAGTYNNHPVSSRYDPDTEKWVIGNGDLGPMPQRAAFNVGVSEGTVAPV